MIVGRLTVCCAVNLLEAVVKMIGLAKWFLLLVIVEDSRKMMMARNFLESKEQEVRILQRR